jgi:hypothetical protein
VLAFPFSFVELLIAVFHLWLSRLWFIAMSQGVIDATADDVSIQELKRSFRSLLLIRPGRSNVIDATPTSSLPRCWHLRPFDHAATGRLKGNTRVVRSGPPAPEFAFSSLGPI